MARQGSKDSVLTAADFRRAEGTTDRRKEPRIPREREITILPCAAPQEWIFKQVLLYDCSRYGIAINVKQPMKRGDEFLAKLRLRNRMTLVLYRVCHCDAVEGWTFKIGANLVEFVGTPAEILDALLADEDRANSPPPTSEN